MLFEQVLAAMLFLQAAWYPPGHEPETEAQEKARYALIAQSITRASYRASGDEWPHPANELAAMLVTIGWWETKFVYHVHAGRCRVKLGECDPARGPNGRLYARARGIWQIQPGGLVKHHEWRWIAGLGEARTDRAAWAAAKILASARARCVRPGANWVGPTISSYATGHSCRWKGAGNRVHTYQKLMAKHFKVPPK